MVRPRHLLRLLLLLLLVARRVWSSATNHMTMQKPQWTAGGQLLGSLITEQFSVSSACRCQSSCLARPECLSVSVTELQDGRLECRLSDHRGHPTRRTGTGRTGSGALRLRGHFRGAERREKEEMEAEDIDRETHKQRGGNR